MMMKNILSRNLMAGVLVLGVLSAACSQTKASQTGKNSNVPTAAFLAKALSNQGHMGGSSLTIGYTSDGEAVGRADNKIGDGRSITTYRYIRSGSTQYAEMQYQGSQTKIVESYNRISGGSRPGVFGNSEFLETTFYILKSGVYLWIIKI